AIAVEQPGAGRWMLAAGGQYACRCIYTRATNTKSPHIAPIETCAELGRFVAMKLQDVGLHLLDDLIDFFGAGIHKQGNDIDKSRHQLAQACGLLKVYRTLAGFVKNQPDGIGACKQDRKSTRLNSSHVK